MFVFFFSRKLYIFSFDFLDLSECQLMQIPDAVYHLMRHTELKRCDLSGNVITKIPAKFAVKFSLITGEYDPLKYSFELLSIFFLIFTFYIICQLKEFSFEISLHHLAKYRVCIVCRIKFKPQSDEQAARGAGRTASSGETWYLAQHFHCSTICRLAATAA